MSYSVPVQDRTRGLGGVQDKNNLNTYIYKVKFIMRYVIKRERCSWEL